MPHAEAAESQGLGVHNLQGICRGSGVVPQHGDTARGGYQPAVVATKLRVQVELLGPQLSFRASMASRAFDSLGEKRPEFPLQFSFLTSAFLIVALMFWQSRALGPARWQWAAPSSHGDSRHPHLMYLHLRGVSESTFFGKKQKLSRMERTSWLPPPGSNRRVSAFFSLQLGMYTMGTWCLNPVYAPSPGVLVVPAASALHPLQTRDHCPPTPPTAPHPWCCRRC